MKERRAALAEKWKTGEANIKKYLGLAKRDAEAAKNNADEAKKANRWAGLGSR